MENFHLTSEAPRSVQVPSMVEKVGGGLWPLTKPEPSVISGRCCRRMEGRERGFENEQAEDSPLIGIPRPS